MNTKTTMAALATAMMLAATGCSAADETEGGISSSESPLTDENDAWKALPLKKGGEVVLHAEHTYAGALADKCGPGYAVDVIVDFGAVTSDTIAVDGVMAFFLPRAGNVVVPRKLDVWSNLTANKQIIGDGSARAPGDTVRYEVKRDYLLDPKDPIVVLELESAGGRAPDDRACRHTTRFVFYPQGTQPKGAR
jgi:hypothetical protein